MKSGSLIISIGITMVILGLAAFYSIQVDQEMETLRSIKHGGTFVGLMGIGVAIAGVLLYLINRNIPTKDQLEQ